ncbi:MAG: amidinotransferase [Dysgonamonadaceae bacterium]|jgi:N-dimethylarginine dimethylaminohydrolase|nr:amidinotransferase [Dysgonamonadaceae bacterium]
MQLNVRNETSTLRAAVLGQPCSIGPSPSLDCTYDAKSYETVRRGVYPKEEKIDYEMHEFERVLLRYGVEIFRPRIIEDCNQVFARDVAFVIDDNIIISNIIPDREDEKEAYGEVFGNIVYSKIFNLPEKAHVEGGDVVLFDDVIFIGIYTASDYGFLKTARTNSYALSFLREICPRKTFIPIELIKHDTDPRKGVLHLDCAFMPVGRGKALIYREGFFKRRDYFRVVEIFGEGNLFHITEEEMYYMNTNIFSLSPSVVVTENRFDRLNSHLENEWGITVERVPYYEISKMGGLLRCSTLPLVRDDD